jgi:8-oxo-dGTP diphosphatase
MNTEVPPLLFSDGKFDIGVFVCVFDDRGRVLCVRRNYGRRNWTTPGGLAEKGESSRQTARRETLEETGFVIDVGDFIGSYFVRSNNNLVLSYLGQIVAITPWQSNEEIIERRFFSLHSLPESLSAEAHVRIADARTRREPVFRI